MGKLRHRKFRQLVRRFLVETPLLSSLGLCKPGVHINSLFYNSKERVQPLVNSKPIRFMVTRSHDGQASASANPANASMMKRRLANKLCLLSLMSLHVECQLVPSQRSAMQPE